MTQDDQNITHFKSLFEKYKEPFTAFALSYLHDENVANDIFSESMMHYWEKQNYLPKNTNIPAYILTIIKNKSLNYLRHEKVRTETEGDILKQQERINNFRISSLEACDPQELFTQELQSLLKKSINRLPKQTRCIFLKSRIENKTNREIAEEQGISTKSVEYHISKALKQLRIDLKDYLPLFILYLNL